MNGDTYYLPALNGLIQLSAEEARQLAGRGIVHGYDLPLRVGGYAWVPAHVERRISARLAVLRP